MKATGIVRRMDDLGRIVIPKEIRRTMRLCEGDPLEIYTGTLGDKPIVSFAKYVPLNSCDQEKAKKLMASIVPKSIKWAVFLDEKLYITNDDRFPDDLSVIDDKFPRKGFENVYNEVVVVFDKESELLPLAANMLETFMDE
jgi:AbrB family looped-hinge helix DNA binding protein